MAPTRIRLTTGAAALLILGAMLAYVYGDARALRFAIGTLAVAAVGAFAYALVARSEPAIGGALAAAAGAYLVHLHADHVTLPLSTAFYAGGLLAAAELAQRSVADGSIAVPAVPLRRWAGSAACVTVAAALGDAAVVTILRSFHGRTPWLEPLGFLAILGAILVFRGELRSRRG
jgi:hypothetical protein